MSVNKKIIGAIVAVFAIGLASGVSVVALIPHDAAMIRGCADKSGGGLRVSQGNPCTQDENAVSWDRGILAWAAGRDTTGTFTQYTHASPNLDIKNIEVVDEFGGSMPYACVNLDEDTAAKMRFATIDGKAYTGFLNPENLDIDSICGTEFEGIERTTMDGTFIVY